ncbi:putative ribonuclease H-like domain-containing protein [Tanacetum coccineum]
MAPVESPQMISTIKLPIVHMLKKGSSGSSSNSQNVVFLSAKDTSSSNEVNTANSSNSPQLDHQDLEQIDHDDLEEMDLKWQVAMLLTRIESRDGIPLRGWHELRCHELLALPDEYQLRFHTIKDAKSLWAAIKKGLDKAYDRFQKIINLLKVHGAAVPNEDANQKFLRALPSSRNNVALFMRNKDGIDDLDINDLYNNLKVFEADIKGSSGSSSNSQNVAFLSAKDTSNSNEVNTANSVSTTSGHNSQGEASSSSYTGDLIFSFFANQSNSPQLDDEDLKQIDLDDLEEMDLKWQVAMLSMSVLIKLRLNALTVIEGAILQGNVEHQEIKETGMEIYIAQDEPTEFALMAYTSNSSGSDTESNLEIIAYQLGLESIEAQLVVHQKNEVVYEEKIAVLEFEVKDKGNAVTRLTNQLEQTLKEKEDLKAKLEQFETSSKNLNKLINSQISSKDKTGLGYGDQLNENDSSGSELFNSVFDSRSSDGDDNQTNDRFKKDNGYHVVPPPLTGNYMPPLADLSFAGLDDSVYRPTTNKTSASVSQVETSITPPSNTSVEMPRVESVRPSGVIIEDWVSDDDEDIFQSNDVQTTVKPSFKKIEFTKARNEPVKSDKQAVKPRMVTQSPKVDRKDWNGKMTQKLGLGFGSTKKAYFVCGSYSHLIKDCDFHEKRMAKKSVLQILTRSGRIPVSTAKQYVNTATPKNIGNPQQALKYKGMYDILDAQGIRQGNKSLTYWSIMILMEVLLPLVKVLGCKIKGEYSIARTPQQNRVAERKNRTLIEAARTMLADSLLPTVFWAEAVNTACYVLNRVLVTKPHNKTPYELIIGRAPSIRNQTNKNVGPQETNGNTCLKKNVDAGQTEEENVSTQQYIVFLLWSSISSNYKSSDDKAEKEYEAQCDIQLLQEKITRASSWTTISFLFGGSLPIDVANLAMISLMPELEDTAEIQSTGIFGNAYDDHDLETLNTVLCRSKVTIVGTVTWIHNNHYAFRMSNVYYCCGEIRTYISEVLENAEALPKNAKYFEGFSSILQFMAFEDHEED